MRAEAATHARSGLSAPLMLQLDVPVVELGSSRARSARRAAGVTEQRRPRPSRKSQTDSGAIAPGVEQTIHDLRADGHGQNANDWTKMAQFKRGVCACVRAAAAAPESNNVDDADSAPIAGRLGPLPKGRTTSAAGIGRPAAALSPRARH